MKWSKGTLILQWIQKNTYFASIRFNLADFIESTLVYNDDRVLYTVKELAVEGCGCGCCY